jgi:hypothetical protein
MQSQLRFPSQLTFKLTALHNRRLENTLDNDRNNLQGIHEVSSPDEIAHGTMQPKD